MNGTSVLIVTLEYGVIASWVITSRWIDFGEIPIVRPRRR